MKARLALLLLLGAACKDEGAEHIQVAQQRYQELVDHGALPTDPRFAEVLELLERVPASSAARPKAETMRRSLLNAQAPRVRTPLAVQGGPNLTAEVAAQLALCRKLAEELGTTGDAERALKLRQLDDCRAAAEALDHAHHDSDAGG